jgi:lipoate-protein ligase A
MNWQLIEYKSFPGKYNMDFDLQLVKNCKPDSPILRFYGWNPYCISIGANQSFNEIDTELTQVSNIDVVKRPTGGRAILHAEELTYSVIMPNSKQISGKKLYEDISSAIVFGLKSYSSKLSEVKLENLNPNFSDLLKNSSGALCFASIAKSEIKYNNKKLVGSAQRKLGTTILQHGSILIGQSHRNLVNYLRIDGKEKSNLNIEIREKTTEISTILGEEVNIQRLQDSLISAFEEVLDAQFLMTKDESILL